MKEKTPEETCRRCNATAHLYIEREAKVLLYDGTGYSQQIDDWELEPHGSEFVCVKCYEDDYGTDDQIPNNYRV